VTRGGGLPDTRHCSRILRLLVSIRDVGRIFALGRRPVPCTQTSRKHLRRYLSGKFAATKKQGRDFGHRWMLTSKSKRLMQFGANSPVVEWFIADMDVGPFSVIQPNPTQ